MRHTLDKSGWFARQVSVRIATPAKPSSGSLELVGNFVEGAPRNIFKISYLYFWPFKLAVCGLPLQTLVTVSRKESVLGSLVHPSKHY